MELKPYKKLTGLEYELSKTVQYTEEFTSQLMPLIFLRGNILEISVSTTATAFDHGLQVTPQGWFIMDKTANIDIWRTAWNDTTITLDATGSGTIKVWVF
jgi:hypothetical protein